jgi:all-trans-retinol 13,14-reductase
VTKPDEFAALGVPVLSNEIAFDKRIPLQITKAGPRPCFRFCLNGMEKLVQVFVEYIQMHGGKIILNTPISKVLIRDNYAYGIQVSNGEQHEADHVILSGGVREAYFKLIGREYLPPDWIAKIENVPFMESVHMVHIGIDFDPTPYQPSALCYYYQTYDINGAIDRCRQGEYHGGKDGFLIYIPSMHSPSMAPPGHHAVTIYTIAPNNLKSGTWARRKDELTEKLLIEAEKYIPGLRSHTTVKIILTPDDFRKWTYTTYHSFGGHAPIRGKTGGPHVTPIKNVWFIGSQSDKQAGGVAGTMSQAKDVIQELFSKIS